MADERDRKAAADKHLAQTRKEVEERVAKAYEHETPTPTQAENDAAKIAAMGTPDLPTDPGAPIDQVTHQRAIEANKPGGDYQTRTKKPE